MSNRGGQNLLDASEVLKVPAVIYRKTYKTTNYNTFQLVKIAKALLAY